MLVGFEFGDIQHPYVIGGLWNRMDPPPTPQAVAEGDVQRRTIVSRSGHAITCNDSQEGALEIKDRAGNTITLDSAGKRITIESAGDLQITAKGNITIEGSGQVVVKGKTIDLN